MPSTPNRGYPYQVLTDAPDGADLGEAGFLAVDADVTAIDLRIDALESAVVYTRIAESILSGTAASVTFSSIPATYRALRLQMLARTDVVATFVAGHIRFNADATAIYDSQSLSANGTSVVGAETLNFTSGDLGDFAAASATAGCASAMVVDIPAYTNTTFWKLALTSHSLTVAAGVAGTTRIKQVSARWRNTAAINSITILPGSGNFIAGSSFALYGLP